ncbi:unnamed protein product [Closterium sp. Naga37s-1]|nr:unnamed protein product [Closterium sp. Naga37s-1]
MHHSKKRPCPANLPSFALHWDGGYLKRRRHNGQLVQQSDGHKRTVPSSLPSSMTLPSSATAGPVATALTLLM